MRVRCLAHTGPDALGPSRPARPAEGNPEHSPWQPAFFGLFRMSKVQFRREGPRPLPPPSLSTDHQRKRGTKMNKGRWYATCRSSRDLRGTTHLSCEFTSGNRPPGEPGGRRGTTLEYQLVVPTVFPDGAFQVGPFFSPQFWHKTLGRKASHKINLPTRPGPGFGRQNLKSSECTCIRTRSTKKFSLRGPDARSTSRPR